MSASFHIRRVLSRLRLSLLTIILTLCLLRTSQNSVGIAEARKLRAAQRDEKKQKIVVVEQPPRRGGRMRGRGGKGEGEEVRNEERSGVESRIIPTRSFASLAALSSLVTGASDYFCQQQHSSGNLGAAPPRE
jgi:hypothetical protein